MTYDIPVNNISCQDNNELGQYRISKQTLQRYVEEIFTVFCYVLHNLSFHVNGNLESDIG